MKKIAIFSDIHGNLQALRSILNDIKIENIEDAIFLGDVIGFGPNPKECLDMIIESNVKMIKGNHEVYQTDEARAKEHLTDIEWKHRNWIRDQFDEKELRFLEHLPMSYETLIDGKLFTFAHFFLNENEDYYQDLTILGDERQYDVVNHLETDYMFVGHSHDPFQIDNSGLFTCVGSSGCRKDDITFYTILEIRSKDVKIYKKLLKYDRETFEQEIKKKNYPDRDKVSEVFFGIKTKK